MTRKVVSKFALFTVNRGLRTFIISMDIKGYYAHELTGLTQWAKVFGGDQMNASLINDRQRRGNQYGIVWKPRPLRSFYSAQIACQIHANIHIQYF